MQVSNVSLAAKEQDLREFFSFSGDIEYLEMKGLVYLFIFWVFQHLTYLYKRFYMVRSANIEK